jgi:hypothetical protein
MKTRDEIAAVHRPHGIEDDLGPFCDALRHELDSSLAAFDNDRSSAAIEFETTWPLAELDADLRVFTQALRSHLDDQLPAPAANHGTPPVRTASKPKLYAIAGITSAAAALLLFFTLPDFRAATLTTTESGDLAAQHVDLGTDSITLVARRESSSRTDVSEGLGGPSVDRAVQDPIAEEVMPVVQPDAGGQDAESELVAANKPASPRPRSIDEANALARKAWEAGDLRGATRWLRYVISRAPHASTAESAYADLFALSRQSGGQSRQIQLWREYLRAFPQGRYAQDARAGVCHNTQGSGALACWRDYLNHHPNGTHRESAKAWLDGTTEK